MEVALKMAFKLARTRFPERPGGARVLGLEGSYHGDTIGAMSASNPTIFNSNMDW